MKPIEILTVYDEKLPDSVKLPFEAYLYFPTGIDIKTGEGKKGVRRIFEGQVTFDTFELEMIQTVKQLLLKQKDFNFDIKRWKWLKNQKKKLKLFTKAGRIAII